MASQKKDDVIKINGTKKRYLIINRNALKHHYNQQKPSNSELFAFWNK